MQLSLFDDFSDKHIYQPADNQKLLHDIFVAYYNARQNKRNTTSALLFEQNYESRLFELFNEITARKYVIQPSVCFIKRKPVQREIFAAHFRDRVVHHLLYNYISPIFERVFINDSYSCRKNKGTSYGIKRVNHFIRSCSQNYQTSCYILQLDIKGYFMAINRQLLYQKVIDTLEKYRYREYNKPESMDNKYSKIKTWNDVFDFDTVHYLLKKIIFNQPQKNYIRKGFETDWDGLPPSKSLFYSASGCGLPIGNLTSQLFSNIYLNDFDHWVTHKLGFKYYGRYVDDFIIVHQDIEKLKELIPKIRNYLQTKLELELHPRKIYLQHYTKGTKFLGAIIKPYRTYVSNQTKGNFHASLKQSQYKPPKKINEKLSKQEIQQFISSVNSFLGIIRQYKSYRLIKKAILEKMDEKMWENVYFSNCEKLVMKKNKT